MAEPNLSMLPILHSFVPTTTFPAIFHIYTLPPHPPSFHLHTIMCNSKIYGRPVLQPATNRCSAAAEPNNSMKKKLLPDKPLSPTPLPPDQAVLQGRNDPNALNSRPPIVVRKKSKKVCARGPLAAEPADAAAGSIAAAQRERAAVMRQQRKLRTAHYGRAAGKQKREKDAGDSGGNVEANQLGEKRCSFITSNSDPVYVAYHDEEWGVPVHDDKVLFELLVLSGFQVGLDWTTILKKRNEFRAAFNGFEAEEVAKFTERQINSICSEYAMDQGRVRGVVDNAIRILEVRRDFGSLDKYFWGFVNHKPLSPGYKTSRKIPAKSSKSESISKDLVRRGFRFGGPTVVHSFMQAAGLTNDHLVSCPRHHHLLSLH